MVADDYDDWSEAEPAPEPEPVERLVDRYTEDAKEAILAYFDEERSRIAYQRQVEVMFEREFFHWVTARAVDELVEVGDLRKELFPLREGTPVRFLCHPSLRYRRRVIQRKGKVLREYAEAAS